MSRTKVAGRTGWATQTLTNSFLSDLVPGFNLSVTHDLWKGQAGTDSAQFSPFLSNVTASFSLTSQTFASIGRATCSATGCSAASVTSATSSGS